MLRREREALLNSWFSLDKRYAATKIDPDWPTAELLIYKSRDECHRINKGSFAAISADDDSQGT